MTLYNVHIYREMRLLFTGVEAESPEQAATVARDRRTDEADAVEDCDGEDLAALVDVVGDEEFRQSVTLDFEHELVRKAAKPLLEALNYLLEQTVDMDLKYGIGLSEGEEDARSQALAVIASLPESVTL